MTFLFGSEKGASLLCHYGDKFETGDTDTDCGARPVVAGQRARWWCDAVMYRLGRLQSGCIPTVHCSAGSGRVPAHCALALPLAPQPSQWQSGPGHNNAESGPQSEQLHSEPVTNIR